MADERDFDLLDDYLTNRMSEKDRSAFQQKINADPDLQQELAVQKRVIKGIQDARIAELKSMLNKVPVPGNATGNAIGSKILLGAVLSIVITAAGYWYFNRDMVKMAAPEKVTEEPRQEQKPVIKKKEEQPTNIISKEESGAVVERPPVQVQTDKNQTSAGTEHSRPSLAKKPDPLQAPGEKSENATAREGTGTDVSSLETAENNSSDDIVNEDEPVAAPDNSSLVVETEPGDGRYTFHYQFGEKLLLYGPFEENRYEIIEFRDDQEQAVFLYYNDNYYLLEKGDGTIRPLTPVNDPSLIKDLQEYRSSR